MEIRHVKKTIFLNALCAVLTLAACSKQQPAIISGGTAAQPETAENTRYTVYLITMDLEDAYWKNIDAGCEQAVAELGGIAYQWIAPDTHEDALQSVCIDQAVAAGADAILISPTSVNGVNESLKKVDEAGIKIIYVDSSASYDCVAGFATDNFRAGQTAGEAMKRALAEAGLTSGTIGIFANREGTSTTTARDTGFRSAFDGTSFTLAPTFFMNDDPKGAKAEVQKQGGYIAFFGTNERTTVAIGEQVLESGSGQLVVGFDTSDAVLSLVQKGVIYATMQQQPKVMGHDGLVTAVRALEGSFTGKNEKTDTGVAVIDKAAL